MGKYRKQAKFKRDTLKDKLNVVERAQEGEDYVAQKYGRLDFFEKPLRAK